MTVKSPASPTARVTLYRRAECWRHHRTQVAHGVEGLLVWAVISYRTKLHVDIGNLGAVRYRDEILRPIVMPFVRQNNTIFQHKNARPHVAHVCIEFLWQKRTCAWLAHICHRSVPNRTRLVCSRSGSSSQNPIPSNNDQLRIAFQEEWKNIPQGQLTTWWRLCGRDVQRYARQMEHMLLGIDCVILLWSSLPAL